MGERMIHILLTVLDLGGTFVFAISGAAAAVKHRLDIFGVIVPLIPYAPRLDSGLVCAGAIWDGL